MQFGTGELAKKLMRAALTAAANARKSEGVEPRAITLVRKFIDLMDEDVFDELAADTVHTEAHTFLSSLDANLGAGRTQGGEAAEWAIKKWHDEVLNRPLQNVHRRTLDDTWRQVIRHFGQDPDQVLPLADHDTLIALSPLPVVSSPAGVTESQATEQAWSSKTAFSRNQLAKLAYAIFYSSNLCAPQNIAAVIEEIDTCGNDCEHAGRAGCSREERGNYCPFSIAEDLRRVSAALYGPNDPSGYIESVFGPDQMPALNPTIGG